MLLTNSITQDSEPSKTVYGLNAAAIPAELVNYPQWVCWKAVKRNDKITKVPLNPRTGGKAKTDDRSTWGTFAEACNAHAQGGGDGIGFVFSNQDPFVGIDLDKCYDPVNQQFEPWAIDVLQELGSYSEMSPSGTGVHIFVKAQLPPGGRRKGQIEIYEHGRFFTMTGATLEWLPREIQDRSAAVQNLHSRVFNAAAETAATISAAVPAAKDIFEDYCESNDILMIAINANDGGKFQRLWNGDITGYQSQSEADQALCYKLAFYTQKDPYEMDRLFRQSGLYRDKWDKPHYSTGQTYGQATIERALSKVTEVYKPKRARKRKPAGGGSGAAPQSTAAPWFDEEGKFIPPRLAEALIEEHHFVFDREEIHVYQNGVYRPEGARFVKQLTLKMLGDRFRDNRGKEVVAYIQTKLWNANKLDENPELINVENGLLSWKSGEVQLLPHTPDNLSSIRIPVVYDPNATCPVIDQFFKDTLPEDCLELIEEVFGYCLIPDTRFEKAIMMLGSGENGKSTLIKLLQTFIGDQNLAHESLQDLAENRFRAAQLAGKLANIFPDLSNKAISDTGYFKALVTGDKIDVERKHQNPFKLYNRARLIFSANEMPKASDRSHAFYRRWVMIRFPNSFPVGHPKRDPHLGDKITQPGELSGLLNKALRGLIRLFKNGAFTSPASTAEEMDKYQLENDSVRSFVSECCIIFPDCRALKSQLFDVYRKWCGENSMRDMSSIKFNNQLQQILPAIQEIRPNGSARQWKGIGIKSEFLEETPDWTKNY